MIDSLPAKWLAGCDARLLETAREAYRSPGRHYHTWAHIEDCIGKLRGFECESPRNVFLALVFHDAIYVPGRQDNESLSAAFCTGQLRAHSNLPPEDIAEIERMILATKEHRADPAESRDLRVLLDIDMSILGADAQRYREYVEAVRREYVPAVATLAQFAAGRRRFLESLLRQPRIYATEEGVARWEAQARHNIAKEIE